MANVRDSNLIVILEHGRIIEHGNHDALVRQGGSYAGLHHCNQASFDDLAEAG